MGDFIDKIFDRTVPAITRSLDLYWKRGEALTSNIANAETPGYRAVDVDFAGALEKAFQGQNGDVRMTNEKHLDLQSKGNAHFVADLTGMTKPDGNNVDLDIQMGKLAGNAGKYSQGASLIRKKLQMMRMAIRYAQR